MIGDSRKLAELCSMELPMGILISVAIITFSSWGSLMLKDLNTVTEL